MEIKYSFRVPGELSDRYECVEVCSGEPVLSSTEYTAYRKKGQQLIEAKYPGVTGIFHQFRVADPMLQTSDTSFIEPGYGPWW